MGTLPIKTTYTSVADPGCLSRIPDPRSRIRLFSIPDPTCLRSGSRIPDPGSASRNLSILTPKKPNKWFLSSRKYDRVVHPGSRIPDQDADFLPIPDPGVKKAPDPGSLPTTPHPLNTSSHKTAARRPPHPYYTQQHTTTLHNSTRVHKTTNVPVVFMAQYVMILRGATSLLGALEGVGPENLNFFGPKWHSLRLCHFRAHSRAHPFQCPS